MLRLGVFDELLLGLGVLRLGVLRLGVLDELLLGLGVLRLGVLDELLLGLGVLRLGVLGGKLLDQFPPFERLRANQALSRAALTIGTARRRSVGSFRIDIE